MRGAQTLGFGGSAEAASAVSAGAASAGAAGVWRASSASRGARSAASLSRSAPGGVRPTNHARSSWTPLKDAAHSAIALRSFCDGARRLSPVSSPALARADALEGEVGLGFGATLLGGRHPTGGITLLPSGSIGWRFAEWGSLRYRNALPVFNLAAIHWIGVIDMNTALLGIHLSHVTLEVGPSLDVFAVPLCADTGCQREHGVAPAGHPGAVLLPARTSRFTARAPRWRYSAGIDTRLPSSVFRLPSSVRLFRARARARSGSGSRSAHAHAHEDRGRRRKNERRKTADGGRRTMNIVPIRSERRHMPVSGRAPRWAKSNRPRRVRPCNAHASYLIRIPPKAAVGRQESSAPRALCS